MPSFTYNPGPDDPEVIRTLGHTFTAGESVEFPDDHPNVHKLRGNRFFSEEGQGNEQGPAFDERQAKANLAAVKKIDGRSKEARDARQKAAEAAATAERLERQEQSSRRALGNLSPSERAAMDRARAQQEGVAENDGDPVPGEPGWRDPNVGPQAIA